MKLESAVRLWRIPPVVNVLKPMLFVFTLPMVIACSSSKVIFTQSTRDRISEGSHGDKIVEKVQFYNDRDIRLVYATTDGSEKITGGKVKFKNGYYYYYVNFPKETPAIAKSINDQGLKLYFETGEDRYLVFRNFGRGHYQLAGDDNGSGFKVNFEGKTFTVEEGGAARLLIKKSDEEKRVEKSREVRGVKVN